MDLTLRYDPAPPVWQMCSEHFLFSVTLHWHFQLSRPAAWGYRQEKREQTTQLTWDNNDHAVSKTRKGQLLFTAPVPFVYFPSLAPNSHFYILESQTQPVNKWSRHHKTSYFYNYISLCETEKNMNFYIGNIVLQKWFPKATFSSDLKALDIQMNVWWAFGSWWGSTDPVDYLKFLYKTNHHRSKIRRDRQEIVLLFKFSSGHPSDHKTPCTL